MNSMQVTKLLKKWCDSKTKTNRTHLDLPDTKCEKWVILGTERFEDMVMSYILRENNMENYTKGEVGEEDKKNREVF